MATTCRGCGADLATCDEVVTYKKTAALTTRWIEGHSYESVMEASDAGLFCSDTCLLVFLQPNHDKVCTCDHAGSRHVGGIAEVPEVHQKGVTMNATFMFYSDAEHIGKLAEAMHRQVCNGDKAAALETLRLIQEKYGDFVGLRLRMEDAVRELQGPSR